MTPRPCPDSAAARALFDALCAGTPAAPPPPPTEPLVLYGAGKLGRMAARMLLSLGCPIACAVDRRPPPDGRLLGQIPVHHPDAIAPAERRTRPIAVCVVTSAFTPIRDQLRADGWQQIHPVYDLLDAHAATTGLGNGWFAGALTADEQERTAQVLARWHDDASRAAHLQFLAWRMRREEWIFDQAPVTIDDRYVIEPLRRALTPRERILDAGAYHGEVLTRLITLLGGQFEAALAIEPDPANAAQLAAHIATLPSAQRARIRQHQCALGERAALRPFGAGQGLASRLRDKGTTPVEVRRLDDLDFSPTLVKLHLEGDEHAALRGAAETLRRSRPLLSVTTYHNRDGIWRTPALLMDALPDYRVLMRLHGWCATGAVIYAIPAERDRAPA